MEQVSQILRQRVKDKLLKRASALTPMIANPLIYGALGAGVGGVASGLKAMYQGAPFQYGFHEGVMPGLQAGAAGGALLGVGPALARYYGKPSPAYNPLSPFNILPASAAPALVGWGAI